MREELAAAAPRAIEVNTGSLVLPAIIVEAGNHAARRILEFPTSTIRNTHTRRVAGAKSPSPGRN
jgi:hypothetical protein